MPASSEPPPVPGPDRLPSERALIAAARRQVERVACGSDAPGGTGHAPFSLTEGAIGPYELLGELHRGAQGVVYRALQRGTKRHVALKVVGAGPFATRAAHARFEREIEVLASLRHPNIVSIHDTGTVRGCFYYVMDLIEGQSLDDWLTNCSAPHRDRRRSLTLFMKLAEAVNAAHVRGVIHRDLKPQNVVVDAAGEPHVLDFGLAKLVTDDSSSVAAREALTQEGQFIGTLAYSSPEQAVGASAEVDTRSDVYALGVMLYEAIAGRLPYPVIGSLDVVLETIRNSTPQPPTLHAAPRADELDAIVLTCLRKEPERRYQNAGELARDLRRYLAGEPVEAKRDSTGYLVRKLLARHRLLIGSATAVALSLVAGLGVSLALWSQAAGDRDRAQVAERDAIEQGEKLAVALADAERSRDSAETSARESSAMRDYVMRMLRSASPASNQGRDISVREMLDDAGASLESGLLTDQPALAATFHMVLGDSYQSLGRDAEAGRHFDRALALRRVSVGEHDPMTHRADIAAISTLVRRGEHQEALERVTTLRASLASLPGADPVDAARAELHAGIVARELGRLDEAAGHLEHALGVLRDSSDVGARGVAANALALVLKRQGRGDESEPLFEEARAAIAQAYGPRDPDLATIANNLGTLKFQQGKLDEADTLFAEVHALMVALNGEDHPSTLTVANNRVALLRRLKRWEEAAALGETTLAVRRRVLGPDHPELATSLNNLALVYADQLRGAEAEPLFAEALAVRERSMPAGHPAIVAARRMHGRALLLVDRLDEAAAVLARAWDECIASEQCPAAERERLIEAMVLLHEQRGDSAEAGAWRARARHSDQ